MSDALRIPYDTLTLRAVTAELSQLLTGGQIQEIRQPDSMEVLLGIRSAGKNYLLLLSADARFARAHLTTAKKPNPPTPPSFCMALRKHMEGRRIRAIEAHATDRILRIQTAPIEESESVTLTAELMGRHSNLILINSEGAIIDSAQRVSKRINRFREVLPGLAYTPPPEQPDRSDPFRLGAEQQILRELGGLPPLQTKPLAEALLQIYAGLSPFLAREIALRVTSKEAELGGEEALKAAWEEIIRASARREFSPVVLADAEGRPAGAYPFPLLQVPAEIQKPAVSLNEALDASFGRQITRTDTEEQRSALKGKIHKERERLERQRHAAERSLEEADKAEEFRHTGELVLANLWRIQQGDEEVTVQDFYTEDLTERTLVLDPRKSPHENAENWFQRARKAEAGKAREEERAREAAEKLTALAAANKEIDALVTREGVLALGERLKAQGLLTENRTEGKQEKQGESEFQGHKIRRFPTMEGFDILVGETSTANDYLTTRVAASNDIWLHVRAGASSHVIIRTHGRPESVPRTVLIRAAVLCARHSRQKHATIVPIDYTLKKYVRKPRGSAPGAADYINEITLEVTPEE